MIDMTSPEATPDTGAPHNDGVASAAKSASEAGRASAGQPTTLPHTTTPTKSAERTPPRLSTTSRGSGEAVTGDDGVNPPDFDGAVDSNHDLPTPETIRKIDHYTVLDRDGKSHTFRSLYTGPHTARRVLIIFVRHFYCGNCQGYLRTLSDSITPTSLLSLPVSTFICVVGCGDPALIDMYAQATHCPFPIYADPTRKLYAELGMIRTLALGQRPAYMKQHLLKSSLESIVQGLKQVKTGLAMRGGDSKQVGGEFLFEPAGDDAAAVAAATPMTVIPPPTWERISQQSQSQTAAVDGEGEGVVVKNRQQSETSLDGKGEPDAEGEDKIVTWCHRMKTTRDHAEIPELMEVLGLEGDGKPIEDKVRWEKALRERKGTGASLAGRGKMGVGS
ncbi:hypothetical protein VTI74DRAFT_8783 [Chaetomium olivicolor]